MPVMMALIDLGSHRCHLHDLESEASIHSHQQCGPLSPCSSALSPVHMILTSHLALEGLGDRGEQGGLHLAVLMAGRLTKSMVKWAP